MTYTAQIILVSSLFQGFNCRVHLIMSTDNNLYSPAETYDTETQEEPSRTQVKSNKDLSRRCSKFWCCCCVKFKQRKTVKPETYKAAEDENEEYEWDQDLGEKEEVPEVFQDWLTATFKPRSNSGPRVLPAIYHPKQKFVDVVTLTRKDVGVGRSPSKTALVHSEELTTLLNDFSNWNFDIHKLQELTQGMCLRVAVKEVFRRYNIIRAFSINELKLENFLDAIQHGYRTHKCAYHNDSHACEVVHAVHVFLQLSGITRFYTDVEVFALLFAAIIHDFEHSGKTNNFHISAQTDLALLYNDNSVQENHHISSAFRVLKIPQCNIVNDMSDEEYREFRRLVISLVLNTDMTFHFQHLKLIRGFLKADKWQKSDDNAISNTMSLILHAADISNPGKPWAMHKACADAILTEFFTQGDEEKKRGLPITPLCDRRMTDIPRTQVTFIEVIVEPCLTVLGEMFDYMLKWDNDDAVPVPTKHRRKSRGVNKRTKIPEPPPESEVPKSRGRRLESIAGQTFFYPRPWANHLQINKAKWIEESIEISRREIPQKLDEICESIHKIKTIVRPK